MTPRHRTRTYLADTVYEALRRAIVEHKFDAGEPLTEHDLCRRFGTSRTPVREALEGLAVRLAAPRVEREDLAGFEARFRAMKAQGRRATYAEVRALGEEFHTFLIKQAGNAKLQEALAQIREQVRSVWNMSIMAPRRAQGLVHEHLALLAALRAGDARRAERLMVAHVRRVRDTIFRLLD